jgi:putative ABC transport system ATP-binding protein
MTLIACEQLTREYRKGDNVIRPLDGLDLSVARGEFLALMGPSGSGKTTLLNMIAGIDRPTAGELHIDGRDITKLTRNQLAAWRATEIGYIFQLYNLVPVLNAFENVELPLLLQPLSRKQRHARVHEALERVGISDRADHYPRQLSGGQEQRVAIARAIVTDPTILVADEPTGDLDKPSARAIMRLMQMLNHELGKTIIMVTHDPGTTRYAKRTLHLDKGKLARDEMVHDRIDTHAEEVAV